MALDAETFDALIDTVRRYVADRLRPLEAEVEANDAIPDDVIAEMKEMGLFGLSIAEEYGGLGLTMLEEAKVAIELGRTTPAFRSTLRHQCRDRQPGPRHGRHARAEGRVAAQDRERRDHHQLRADRARCRHRIRAR